MTVPVRILFADGAAEWSADEGAWRPPTGSGSEPVGRCVPNIEEWESFWLRGVATEVEVDARDLCFDGNPSRSIDWAYRGRRWVSERGRGAPTSGLPECYTVVQFDEGWVLFDEILERLMFLVAAPAVH